MGRPRKEGKMIKEKMNEIKDLIVKKEEGENNKKKIENIVVFVVILIITIIMINTIWKTEETENTNIGDEYKLLADRETNRNTEDANYQLEKNLENILEKIEGVGKVSVLITYSESKELIAMYNENLKESQTEETDSGGGNRKITETDSAREVIYREENGEKIPVTQKLIMPKIEGAIVTAQGATSSEIKANIIQAVEAVTGLPTHKVQVFQMKAE